MLLFKKITLILRIYVMIGLKRLKIFFIHYYCTYMIEYFSCEKVIIFNIL